MVGCRANEEANAEGRRQKAEGPKRGMRNAEWGNLDSGVLDKGLGCRALRLLGRNGEIRESGGKVTAWFFPQPRSIESRGWPQAGRDHGSAGASPYRLGGGRGPGGGAPLPVQISHSEKFDMI